MVYNNTMRYSLSANILSLTLRIYDPLEQSIASFMWYMYTKIWSTNMINLRSSLRLVIIMMPEWGKL